MSPDFEHHCCGRLSAELIAKGWIVEVGVRVPGSERYIVDMIARKESQIWVIEVKAVLASHRGSLAPLAAAGLLQARKYASLVSGEPMVVVGAPRWSPAKIQELRQFFADFGDGANWGIVDDLGLLEFHAPALEGVQTARSPRPRAARDPRQSVSRSDPFSDLSQWCLKVLLSHLLPAELQIVAGEQRVEGAIRHAHALAKIADVSPARAWRTVSALQAEGLLARSDPLGPLDTEALLRRWQAANLRQGPEIRARWFLPAKQGALERLRRELGSGDATRGRADTRVPRRALGLFAAAEVLGYGFVRGVAPHLIHEDPSVEALKELGLRAASPSEGVDVFVRKPLFPEATFRGVTQVHGVPVTDVFQIWLDVSAHPARGQEMADHLAEHVFSRFLPAAGEEIQ